MNAIFGVVRRGALAKTQLLPSYAGADYTLLGELARPGKFVEVPESLFRRRLHPAASSQNRSGEVLDGAILDRKRRDFPAAVEPQSRSLWYYPASGSEDLKEDQLERHTGAQHGLAKTKPGQGAASSFHSQVTAQVISCALSGPGFLPTVTACLPPTCQRHIPLRPGFPLHFFGPSRFRRNLRVYESPAGIDSGNLTGL